MGKKNPYDSKYTMEQSQQERQKRDAQIETTQGRLDTAQGTINPLKGALEKYYSPEWQSSYAKGQATLRQSDTNKAFNNSLAANRMRANMAGFGYNQPATATNDVNIENARAAELARIPAETQKEAADMEMRAITQGQGLAGLETGLANTEAGLVRDYDPNGLYQTGVQQAEQEAARRGGLWKSLAKLGLTAASPVTGGTTGVMASMI